MSTPAIFDRIRALEHLTPSKTKIAQYLDKAYPLLALETVTSISARARVGRATVVRFISRMGYSRPGIDVIPGGAWINTSGVLQHTGIL